MLNNKKVSLFKNYCDVGGYFLPADFPYIAPSLLDELKGLSFKERIKLSYSFITGRSAENLNFSKIDELDGASLLAFDDCLASLDLTEGKTASYSDYFFDDSDFFGKVASVMCLFISTYLDLVNSAVVDDYDSVNFSVPTSDGVFVLALYILKRIGLPINIIICPIEKFEDLAIKGVFLSNYLKDECDEVVYEFFNEFGYLFDEISASTIIAIDEYYDSYEDEKFTITTKILSPYYNSRSIYKTLTGKNEISIDKAILKLYEESAESIPPYIKDGKNHFYTAPISLDFHTAFSIIKSAN